MEMQALEVFKFLIVVFSSIGLMNIFSFWILWRRSGSEYYKLLFLAWLFGLFSLVGHLVIQGQGPLGNAAAFIFIFPYGWYMSLLLSKLARVSFPGEKFLIALVVLTAIGITNHFLGLGPFWTLFPVSLACSVHLLYVSVTVFLRRWRSLSVMLKGFTFFMFLAGLHNLDYAFLYEDITLVAVGFSFGLFLTVAFTLFGISAALDEIWREKAALELDLKYRAQLNYASKLSSMGEVAGGVAHEINNPLQIIQGLAEMMERGLRKDEVDRKAVLSKIQTMKQNISRITSIVSGLIAFSRDGSQDPIRPEPVANVISNTLALYGGRIVGKGIELQLGKIPTNLSVLCRSVEASQVLVNLLNNSKDAVEGASEQWIRIEIEDLEKFVVISVIDSGPGIPENLREKIFQPFFTTKEVDKGTGLGLSVAKGLAKSQGGDLFFLGEAQHTTFNLLLPKGPQVYASEASHTIHS